MKFSYPHASRRVFGLLATVVAVAAICWLGSNWLFQPAVVEAKLSPGTEALLQVPISFDINDPKVQAALAAQNRHTPQILSQPDVVGTATGVNNVAEPTVVVYTKKAIAAGTIPDHVDGIPVTVTVTGKITPMQVSYYFPRPVPIGVSVGIKGECSSGTIGARVKDLLNRTFALSNNHVLAMENDAPLGSRLVQPGLYDLACVFSSSYGIGSLYDFEPISFTGDNIMDAAIAGATRTRLGRATPTGGYGTPKSATAAAVISQRVQKYGRTTALTRGTITGLNAIFDVDYGDGITPRLARFVNQIVVQSARVFILPGDSGSLLVNYPSNNPVGLLFAGDSTGKLAIANPINPVLQRFGVTIDGIGLP
jgi:hypothetical protein